ncbi:MAG TPA: DNA-binding transcriptional regulator Fis [Pseudomonadales bacterium]
MNSHVLSRDLVPDNLEARPVREQFTHAPVVNAGTIREGVALAMKNYLTHLDGEDVSDVYDMVLAEVEAPLLEAVMQYTRNNQTRAANMLGLNRGTLRKKLKQYNML